MFVRITKKNTAKIAVEISKSQDVHSVNDRITVFTFVFWDSRQIAMLVNSTILAVS